MPNLIKIMANLDRALLKSKFRGSMLGSLVGDCLGSPYEGDTISAGDKVVIQSYFDKLESPDFKGILRCYTDDTAMMKSVAQSFVDKPEIDYKFLAQLFVKEYFKEPDRGYGQNIRTVFQKLRKTKFEDVFKPAAEQFDGRGSFGNGGGMRIAPVALYFYNDYNNMVEVARKSTELTHTHPIGVHGALLQCMAVQQALCFDPKTTIDSQTFCDDLIEKIRVIEKENDDGLGLDHQKPYENKLQLIKQYLKENESETLEEDVLINLGNSINAYDSIPTAIYCFLRAIKNDISTVNTDNLYRRTIQYAISLGGDTDTIACMAGGIAGAYVGHEGINTSLSNHCEYNKEMVELADKLYNAAVK